MSFIAVTVDQSSMSEDFRNGHFFRVVPVPVGERERLVADELSEDALVEEDEGAVPGEEEPGAVDLEERGRVDLVVRAGAVEAVIIRLPEEVVGMI